MIKSYYFREEKNGPMHGYDPKHVFKPGSNLNLLVRLFCRSSLRPPIQKTRVLHLTTSHRHTCFRTHRPCRRRLEIKKY